MQLDSTSAPSPDRPAAGALIEFDEIWRWLRRNMWLILAFAIIGALLGFVFARSGTPTYTATSSLMIDDKKVQSVRDAYAFSAEGSSSSETDLFTQIEVLRSDTTLGMIVDKLKLANGGARVASSSLFASLKKIFGLAPAAEPKEHSPDSAAAKQAAIDGLRFSLLVRRIPRTHVIEIAFTSPDPKRAAEIANSVANAYIEGQRLLQQEATRSAVSFLQEQLAGLKQNLIEADDAIQKFKVERGLVTAEGHLVGEQRLAEANRQLITTRTELAKTQARYAKLQTIIKGQLSDVSAQEFFSDPVILQLRNRYMAIDQSERELAAKLGERHEATAKLRSQKAEFEQLMREELQRIANTMRTEIDIAQARETDLMKQFNQLASETSQTNEEQIPLRELDRRSEAYRTVYAATLQRYETALQQQAFDERGARTLNPAQEPTQKDGPPLSRVLAFATLLGALAGGGLGYLREQRNNTYRSSREARRDFGSGPIWLLPARSKHNGAGLSGSAGFGPELPPWAQSSAAFAHVAHHPGSRYALIVGAVKLELDRKLQRGQRRIGVVSVTPGDSHSSFASNLAICAAYAGGNTLLIDSCLKEPALTRQFAPEAGSGLADAARDPSAARAAVIDSDGAKLSFLPAPYATSGRTADVLASASTADFLTAAVEEFDYVIIDLPPLSAGIEAYAIAPQLDAVVLVVDWGKTPRSMVQTLMTTDSVLKQRCLGVVVAETNFSKLSLYQRPEYLGMNQKS